ncbi:hypothetical protein DEO72_LG5g931 [Vigna unguiculata]|uniref:Uncharacterized protein n=1 Tax=Vigna unguiculata TaxID=3917 RepID=A0A4D6LVA1_VIGUN|nr:hypothetical protein DEO72_LG5g931 [Vigna unguiculata]
MGLKVYLPTIEPLGPGSSFGIKTPEVELLKLLETTILCDIDISLDEVVLPSLENMEPNALVKEMLEFNSKALMGQHVVEGTKRGRESQSGAS